jgi:hypothetical protein
VIQLTDFHKARYEHYAIGGHFFYIKLLAISSDNNVDTQTYKVEMMLAQLNLAQLNYNSRDKTMR